jgi:hypothetical protein
MRLKALVKFVNGEKMTFGSPVLPESPLFHDADPTLPCLAHEGVGLQNPQPFDSPPSLCYLPNLDQSRRYYYLGLNLSNILIIGHTDQGYFQNVFGIVLFPNKIRSEVGKLSRNRMLPLLWPE